MDRKRLIRTFLFSTIVVGGVGCRAVGDRSTASFADPNPTPRNSGHAADLRSSTHTSHEAPEIATSRRVSEWPQESGVVRPVEPVSEPLAPEYRQEFGEASPVSYQQTEGSTALANLVRPASANPVTQESPSQQLEQIEPRDLLLDDVVASTIDSYPLILSALLSRDVAQGNYVSAWGAFDTKIKGSTENGPLGYYETYRHGLGATQPIFQGGEAFAGYRVGRGNFQPWYLERQTNEGGEFKAGIIVPLNKDRAIDDRRADLSQARIQIQQAEPQIQAQIIESVRYASYSYWEWVAAARRLEITERILSLAVARQDAIKRRVEINDADPPVLDDNQRMIALREAKVTDAKRKLDQAGYKLSLFYRDEAGTPLLAERQLAPELNPPEAPEFTFDSSLNEGLQFRPEIRALQLDIDFYQVDRNRGANDTQASLNALLAGSQDVGEPTSAKRDKSPAEVDAGLYLDVPLQRRKGLGKMSAAEAKIQATQVKLRLVREKISVEIRNATIAIDAALIKVSQTEQAMLLAEKLADIERRKFELGESDLLAVNLREEYAAESAIYWVDAILEFHLAIADLEAAKGSFAGGELQREE